MKHIKEADEQVIEKARRVVAVKRKFRWFLLLYAILFLGMCGYFTVAGIRKVENLEQLSLGFVYGVAMAVLWMTFGTMGGLCLGKFLTGLQSDYRLQELLISYHDRLSDLGQLPGATTGEHGAPPSGGPAQRVRNSNSRGGPPSVS